jgi:hypothetical protein
MEGNMNRQTLFFFFADSLEVLASRYKHYSGYIIDLVLSATRGPSVVTCETEVSQEPV